jgi:hypothetical protein
MYNSGNGFLFPLFLFVEELTMKSTARTIEEYLADLPADRREAIKKVRQTILENLPEGYE